MPLAPSPNEVSNQITFLSSFVPKMGAVKRSIVITLCLFASACAQRSIRKSAAIDTEGLASYYGPNLHGKRTASGEIFNQNALTAAHRSAPFGTCMSVTNLENGQDVEVRVNDRGPFVRDRIIDVSKAAAVKLGMIARGVARVRIERCPP